jgi:hypothetical protein
MRRRLSRPRSRRSRGPFRTPRWRLHGRSAATGPAADAALRTLIDRDANSSAYLIAEIYALRNDAKAIFEWLDRAWSNRDPGILNLHFDPFILRFRDDPRFAAFCRKVGLSVPGETSSRRKST